jgi:hypothetical protein
MKGSLNSRPYSPPTRSLFVFTEKSVLNSVLTLDFRVCRYTTGIMAFCFVMGTDIESVIVVKGKAGMSIAELKDDIYDKKKYYFGNLNYDSSDLHLWKVDIPVDAENDKFVKLKTLESRCHNEDTIMQELEGQKLTAFEDFGDIFNSDSKNICIIVQPLRPDTTGKCFPMVYLSNKNRFYCLHHISSIIIFFF